MAKKKKRLTKAERSQISDLCFEARNHLHLWQWDVSWVQMKHDEHLGDNEWMLAEAIVSLKYVRAKIQFYPRAVQLFREDREAFIKLVYHELAHILTAPAKDWMMSMATVLEKPFLNEQNEQLTETIGRIGYDVRCAEKAKED